LNDSSTQQQNAPSQSKPGIEQVQVLDDISRSALCCHSNKNQAPIPNLPNSAQWGGAPSTISPSYIGENTVVRAHGEGRQMRMTNVHFA